MVSVDAVKRPLVIGTFIFVILVSASIYSFGFGSIINPEPTDSAHQFEMNFTDVDISRSSETSITYPIEISGVDEEDPVDIIVEYRESEDEPWQSRTVMEVSEDGAYAVTLDDLDEQTEYQMQTVAVSDTTEITTEPRFFTTRAPEETDLPTVITRDFTTLTYNSITFSGRVTEFPVDKNYTVYFEYRVRDSEEWQETERVSLSESGSFTRNIETLVQNTNYQYRAVVETDGRSNNGQIRGFTTPEKAELRITNKELRDNDTTYRSATLRGEINELGVENTTEVTFQYRSSQLDDWRDGPQLTISETGSFNYTITELDSSTIYQYRILGVSDQYTVRTEAKTFATNERDRVGILSRGISNTTWNSTNISAEVVDLGRFNSTIVSFEYREDGSDTWEEFTSQTVREENNVITSRITGLKPDTLYQYRATSFSDGETEFSNSDTFTTPERSELVIGSTVANKKFNNATIQTNTLGFGIYNSANISVQYRQTGVDEWAETEQINRNSLGSNLFNLTILRYNTTYEYRGKIESQGEIEYTDIKTFETSLIPDINVETTEITGSENQRITFSGNLETLDAYEEAEVFIEYRKAGAEEWEKRKYIDTYTSPRRFSTSITGLESGTEYEYRMGGETINREDVGDIEIGETRLDFKITMETLADSDARETQADIRGDLEVLDRYDSAQVYAEYRKIGADEWQQTDVREVTEEGVVNYTIKELETDTTYQYQFFAETELIESGGTNQFTTLTEDGFRLDAEEPDVKSNQKAVLKSDLVQLEYYDSAEITYEIRRLPNNESTDDPSGNESTGNESMFPLPEDNSWYELSPITVSEPGIVEKEVTNLRTATEYEYRATARINNESLEQPLNDSTNITNFRTEDVPDLSVETRGLERKSDTNMTVTGEVINISDIDSAQVFFEYAPISEDESWEDVEKSTTEAETIGNPGEFTHTINDLESDTTYQYRANISVGFTSDVGEIREEKTRPEAKFGIQTLSPSKVTPSIQTLIGRVSTLQTYDSADLEIQYRKQSESEWKTVGETSRQTATLFDQQIKELEPNTEYEYRARGTVEEFDGTETTKTGRTQRFETGGERDVSFTTEQPETSYDKATLIGNINDIKNYDYITVQAKYTRVDQFEQKQTREIVVNDGDEPKTVKFDIDGLTPQTAYEYRLDINAQGDGYESQSNVQFVTEEQPSLIKSITEIRENTSSAEVDVNISSANGIDDGADLYLEYRNIGNGFEEWQKTEIRRIYGTGTYTLEMSNLISNSEYEVRPVIDARGDTFDENEPSEFITKPQNTSESIGYSPECPSIQYSGSGTDSDPYEVSNIHKLQCISANDKEAQYELTKNIDASGTAKWSGTFDPIELNASGYIYGQNKTIYNLTIDKPGQNNVGLLRNTDNITNIGIENATIRGADNVGGLIGSENASSVENVYVRDTEITGRNVVGGIVSRGSVDTGYYTGNISGDERVGGIAGIIGTDGIKNVYVAAGIQSSVDDIDAIAHTGQISVSCNTGLITGCTYTQSNLQVSNAYYASDITQATNSDAVGLNVESMQNKQAIDNLETFDFENTWSILTPTYTETPTLAAFGGRRDQTPTCTNLSFEGGTGTIIDPYQVATVDQLQCINNFGVSHYEIVSNIDASETKLWNNGKGFEPIGSDGDTFRSYIDGNQHIIQNISINYMNRNNSGLFGRINKGYEIHNITIRNASINGQNKTGGLIGYSRGNITNINIENARISGEHNVGGIIGLNAGTTTEKLRSVSTHTITGEDNVGGIVGSTNASIENSYARIDINSNGSGGGLIGSVTEDPTINKTYATGNVSADQPGGLIANTSAAATVADSYWSEEESKVQVSDGGSELNASSMIGSSPYNAFAGFDFEETWTVLINPEEDYPEIRSFDTTPDRLPSVGFRVEPTCDNVEYEGSGSDGSPYYITNIDQLQCISEFSASASYYITDNITADSTITDWYDGRGFRPIGATDSPFNGFISSGRDYSIQNIYINRSTENVGLIGYSEGGEASNIRIANSTFKGENNTGAVLGSGSITTNSVTVINSTVEGETNVGGLYGNVYGKIDSSRGEDLTIQGTRNVGGITGAQSGTMQRSSSVRFDLSADSVAGGLVGVTQTNNEFGSIEADVNNTVKESYAIANDVDDGVTVSNEIAGGLVGQNQMTLIDSYSLADVRGNKIGSVVGRNNQTINTSFGAALVNGDQVYGGFVGVNNGNINNSYYNSEETTVDDSDGGSLVTNTDLMVGDNAEDTLEGFNFRNVWIVDSSPVRDYPELQNNEREIINTG